MFATLRQKAEKVTPGYGHELLEKGRSQPSSIRPGDVYLDTFLYQMSGFFDLNMFKQKKKNIEGSSKCCGLQANSVREISQ